MIRLVDQGKWLAEVQGRRIPAGEVDSYIGAAEFLEAAGKIHTQALQEAEKIKIEAWEEGYKAGLEQARSDVYEGMLEVTKTIRQQLDNRQQQIMQLTMAIVQKVLPRLPSEEIILSLIQEALAELQDERQLQVYVRPELIAFAEQWLRQWRQEHPDISRLEVLADPGLGPLGCRVESEFGILVVDPIQDVQKMTTEAHRNG